MGVSLNSKVFLSDKDLKGGNNMDPKMGLLVYKFKEIKIIITKRSKSNATIS